MILPKINKPLGTTLVILISIFLISRLTTEVLWSSFDYLVAGVLFFSLFYTIQWIKTNQFGQKYTPLLIGLVILLFTLMWVELSVGVFGTIFSGN